MGHFLFQALLQNDSVCYVQTWAEVKGFELTNELGVTMTCINGDYTNLGDYLLGRDPMPGSKRNLLDLGSFSFLRKRSLTFHF